MKIILTATNLARRGQLPGKQNEPAHLLGMYHILRRAGHRVKILNCPTPRQLAKAITGFSPNFIGFSTYRVAEYDLLKFPVNHRANDSLQDYGDIINGLKERNIGLILGGRGVTSNPEYFINTYRPDIVIKGLGELPMLKLAEADFRVRDLERDQVYREEAYCTPILQSPIGAPWPEISFERPYPLATDLASRVIVQIGCFGRCIFCAEDHNVRYRSLEYSLAEIEYLAKAGAPIIALDGPNFTANPDQAARLIDSINRREKRPAKPGRTLTYTFMSREDSLHRSLVKHRDIWRHFAHDHPIYLGLGLETFLPDKAVALGKYRTKKQALGMPVRLREIADAFHSPANILTLFWILFWHQGNFAEAKREVNQAVELLSRYEHITIDPRNVANSLHPLDGTRIPDLPSGITDPKYAVLYLWAKSFQATEIDPRVSNNHGFSTGEMRNWIGNLHSFINFLETTNIIVDTKGCQITGADGETFRHVLPRAVDGSIWNEP